MRGKSQWIISIILLLLCTVIEALSIGTASGEALPAIFVDPSTSTVAPSENFLVNINVTGIAQTPSLYGWEVEMNFNSSVVTAVNAVEGPFLKTAGATFWLPLKINNTAGYVHIGALFMPPFPPSGAIGGGTLATISFHAEAQGTTSLHFSTHELYTVIGDTTLPINHVAVDGDVTVSSMVPVAPVANFTYSPLQPIVGETVTFNASNSQDPDGTISTYAWDFGDGTVLVYVKDVNLTVTTEHAYTKAGTYTVILTVTDNDSLTDTATTDVQVLVHDIAVINVEVLPNTVEIGENVSIKVMVVNKGNFSQTFDVSVYYASSLIGTKTVTLAARTSQNLTFSWNTAGIAANTFTIKAQASPVPDETDQTNNTFIDGTVTVKAPPQPPTLFSDIFLYIMAGIVIIIVAAAAFYFLRSRK